MSKNPLKLSTNPRPLVNGPHIRTDLKLLEVDSCLLGEILSTGVVIKGLQASNEAVMCTRDKTYALKYVETTNCQLLSQPAEDLRGSCVPGSQGSPGDLEASTMSTPPGLQTQLFRLHRSAAAPVAVTATTSGHIEVLECGPHLDLLHQMLTQRPYGLEDEEADAEHQERLRTDQEGSKKRQACESDQDPRDGYGRPCLSGSCSRVRPEAWREDVMVPGRQGDPSTSSNSHRGMYTFDNLVQVIQASPKEIQAELAAMGAVELDGYWRCVDPGYLGQLLELIILSAQEQGHPLTAIPASAMANTLSREGYLPQLVTHCLRVYGHPVDGEEEGSWSLDERKVCIYFMDKVLSGQDAEAQPKEGSKKRPLTLASAASTARPLSDFMQQWRGAVPSGMQPDLSMLKGEVVVEGKGNAAVAHLLSIRQLPINPKQRFERLFAFKPQWEASELEPYLQGMQAPGQTPAMLLLKYARASQAKADAPTFYTSR